MAKSCRLTSAIEYKWRNNFGLLKTRPANQFCAMIYTSVICLLLFLFFIQFRFRLFFAFYLVLLFFFAAHFVAATSLVRQLTLLVWQSERGQNRRRCVCVVDIARDTRCAHRHQHVPSFGLARAFQEESFSSVVTALEIRREGRNTRQRPLRSNADGQLHKRNNKNCTKQCEKRVLAWHRNAIYIAPELAFKLSSSVRFVSPNKKP